MPIPSKNTMDSMRIAGILIILFFKLNSRMTRIVSNPLVNFTKLKVLAAEIYGPINVKAVHLYTVAVIKRFSDNRALFLICE